MENFLTTFQQIKSSDDEKYDVVYVNTPWNRLSPSQMSKLSIKDLAKENSLLYIWADTYTMADTVALINNYGYEFESVYLACDIASYPAPVAPKTKVLKEAGTDTTGKTFENITETKTGAVNMDVVESTESTPVPAVAVEEKKAPLRRAKKSRCPPLNPPKYYTTTDRGSSRGTTEYLMLAFRGDSSVLTTLSNEKAGTLPYQVVRKPELGRKSRSVPKKNINLDPEWQVDRPVEFLETVQAHLKPEVKVLELFGSTMRDNVDSLGPNVPGGFCPGYTSTTGITFALNKCLRSMRKIQLQTLVSSLTKMGQTEDRAAKIEEFKKISDTWTSIKKALVDMKGNVTYDWSSDDEALPVEWLRLIVLGFAQKNVAGFSDNRRRKKKRTASTGPKGLFGIAKPRLVSPELTEFLGLAPGTKISRTSAVKKLNEYVKTHMLQNAERKIEIVPDAPLKKILNPPEGIPVTYFKMCSMLSSHFDKKYDVEDTNDVKKGKENVVEESNKKARVA